MVVRMIAAAWVACAVLSGCETVSGGGAAGMLATTESTRSKQAPPPALVDIGDKLIRPGAKVEVEAATDDARRQNDVILLREEVADPSGQRPRNAFAAGLFAEEVASPTDPTQRFKAIDAPGGPAIGPAKTRPKLWWEYWRSRWPLRESKRVTAGSGAFTMPGTGGATVLLVHRLEVDPARDSSRVYLIRSGGVHPNGTLSVFSAARSGAKGTQVDLPPAGESGDWYVDMLPDGSISPAQRVIDPADVARIRDVLAYAALNGMHEAFP